MAQHTFPVGQKKRIGLGGLRFASIVYCGMPNENTFSITHLEVRGHAGYSWNLYYPKNVGLIKIRNTQFQVVGVNPKELILEMY